MAITHLRESMEEGFGAWSTDDRKTRDHIRVLHVDDDPNFGELAVQCLEGESDRIEVVSATAAADGLDLLREHEIDCIVSDYQMPGRNGLEFFETIPAAESVPFVLFTGKGSEEVASDAFSAGVTDYLQKERGIDQFTVLAKRIERAVAEVRARRRLEVTRRQFKTLVEESNDAILVVSAEADILYATPATEHILGRTPSELVGTSGFDPLHEDDVPAVAAELERLLEDPDYRARVECRYHHADGSWIRCEVRGRNLLDREEIGGIVVYVRDVEERRE